MSPNAGSDGATTGGTSPPLRILHVMRAPVGGLFRHVVDLARGQAERGHEVGIVADATTGAQRAEAVLSELRPHLALGIVRLPMNRHIGASDIAAAHAVRRHAATCAADVVHGHGAKGGAYARLTGGNAIRVYTPHGGSLHYRSTSAVGFLYLNLERVLTRRSELFLFESAYGRDAFRERVGEPGALTRVVHNGVGASEFAPVPSNADATDLLYIGELRFLKGVDVLIDAIALLRRNGVKVSATLVGDGPDAAAFRVRVRELDIEDRVSFPGAMPARTAFARGRILVVPSRAESLPYVVLEGGASGLPIIATNVGGIPEIFGPQAGALVPPGRPDLLASSIQAALGDELKAVREAALLRERIASLFSTDAMVEGVLVGYREARVARSPQLERVELSLS